MGIDAVITELELQLESKYSRYGHYVALRFIDIKPSFPRVKNTLLEIKKNEDMFVVGHKYTFEEITEKTYLSYLNITRH